MSSVAVDGPGQLAGPPERTVRLLRRLDLVVLALALVPFALLDWPLVGYAAAAAAWLVQRGLQHLATARAKSALGRGDRRVALGAIAGATLGRVWIVTLAILLVGLIAEREDGLAAAVLSFVLVTVSLISEAFVRLLDPGAER